MQIKCNTCRYREIRLKCLKCEQQADQKYPRIKHQIINPTRTLRADLSSLTLAEKTVWGTIKSGAMIKSELGSLLHKHPVTIWRIYRRALRKLG